MLLFPPKLCCFSRQNNVIFSAKIMLLFPPKSCCFSRQNFGTSWLTSCQGYLPFPSTTVCNYAQYIGGVRSKCCTFSHSYRTVLYMRLNRCCTVKTLYRKI
jgi:hypothetical protein